MRQGNPFQTSHSITSKSAENCHFSLLWSIAFFKSNSVYIILCLTVRFRNRKN
jgi:hypothetical protein